MRLKKIDLNKADDLFPELYLRDFVGKLEDAGYLGKSHVWNPLTDKVERIFPVSGHSLDAAWVFPKDIHDTKCERFQMFFYSFKGIHSGCSDCWKVVIRPRTIKELLQLYNLQVDMDVDCKCGLEEGRPYVSGNYGGNFYCKGKEEGLQRKLQVKKEVERQISKTLPVTLKKNCTEFEQLFSDIENYEQSEETKRWEVLFESYVQNYPKGQQVPLIALHNIHKWFRKAWEIGDPTVREFNKGEPFFKQPKTY